MSAVGDCVSMSAVVPADARLLDLTTNGTFHVTVFSFLRFLSYIPFSCNLVLAAVVLIVLLVELLLS